MKLVANRINGVHLRDLLPAIGVEVDGVLAAVAYGSSASDITQDLVGHCVANKLRWICGCATTIPCLYR